MSTLEKAINLLQDMPEHKKDGYRNTPLALDCGLKQPSFQLNKNEWVASFSISGI